MNVLMEGWIHGCINVYQVRYLTLLLGSLQYALLDGSLADEPVHGDLLGLAEAVGAVHGLLVHRRVPVAVVEDHLWAQ